jgi:hypothetical protein
MEDLIRQVSERAGISEDQARTAVQTVAEFAKQKVPAPYNSYIDKYLGGGASGGTSESGGMGDIAGKIGNMFGGKG